MQDTFQTDDRATLEAFCRDAGIDVEWRRGDRLRTAQRRPAIARHPTTREKVWLNHLPTLHPSMLEPARRKMLEKMFGSDGLLNDVRFGDGGTISDEVVATVRAAHRGAEVSRAWRHGDCLILDNLLVAHGRSPFVGNRTVVVAMGSPTAWTDL